MELRWGSRMTHETKYELASFETRLSLPDELATLNSIVVCGDERAQLRRQEISSDRIRVITPSKLDTEKVCNPKRKHQIAYRFHWRRNDSVQMEFRWNGRNEARLTRPSNKGIQSEASSFSCWENSRQFTMSRHWVDSLRINNIFSWKDITLSRLRQRQCKWPIAFTWLPFHMYSLYYQYCCSQGPWRQTATCSTCIGLQQSVNLKPSNWTLKKQCTALWSTEQLSEPFLYSETFLYYENLDLARATPEIFVFQTIRKPQKLLVWDVLQERYLISILSFELSEKSIFPKG